MFGTDYNNSWLNMTFSTCENAIGDSGTTGPQLSDMYSQIYGRLTNGVSASNYLESNGIFNGTKVEVWNQSLADLTDDNIDWDIEHFGGKTGGKVSKINATYFSSKCLSHECGHLSHQQLGLEWDGLKNFLQPSTEISKQLLGAYRALRTNDFTDRTNEVERWAEDFKFFFGADGCALSLDPNDDANHPELVGGKVVRWACNVDGLKEFIKYSWPIYDRMKNEWLTNFQYFANSKMVQWYHWWQVNGQWIGQWECFYAGKFYKAVNGSWVAN